MVGAGFVGAALATLIGLPVLRRRGLTLAVVTLAFGLATTAWLLSPRIFGEGTRFDWLPPPRVERPDLFGLLDVRSETRFYFLCLVALALVVVGVVGIRRSRSGRVFIAIRENERAAASFGVNPRRATLSAFAISGFLAAFAGALFVHQQNGLQLDSYTVGESLVVFTMVVIGGLGSVPGALLGALFVPRRHVVAPGRVADRGDRRRHAPRAAGLPGRVRCGVRRPARRRVATGRLASRHRRTGAHRSYRRCDTGHG